jgi:Sec-independent protein translocase protein TatA
MNRLLGLSSIIVVALIAVVLFATRTNLPFLVVPSDGGTLTSLQQDSEEQVPPQEEESPTLEPEASPTPLPTEITEFPTPDDPGIIVTAPPVPEPEYTEEPIPTAMPTPVTTPIPQATPPYIEGIEAQPAQPFWMYWVQGDEVWRIDGQGEETQLVVDSFVATGQHIAGPPEDGSDCCETGPDFAVSPDQKKLALVTLDPALIDPNIKMSPENYATAIHIYNTETGESQPLGEGIRPIWSPDSNQVAFLRDSGLWVTNIETGEVTEKIQPQLNAGLRVATYAWSPDSTQLAFMYAAGSYTWIPQIWVLSLIDSSEPKLVLSREAGTQDLSILAPTWAPDGRSIYYLSSENDGYASLQFQNLWRVSIEDGTVQPITTGMTVTGFDFLPGQPWLYLTALGMYDFALGEDVYYNIWLVNSEDSTLRRLTAREENWYAFIDTPDGSNLLVADQTWQLQLFSLADGTLTPLDAQVDASYILYGGTK